MTMKREDLSKAQSILKGKTVREHMSPQGRTGCLQDGRGHFNMTPKEYAARVLGRRSTDAQTATAKKMERMGYVATDRGGFKKTTRK